MRNLKVTDSTVNSGREYFKIKIRIQTISTNPAKNEQKKLSGQVKAQMGILLKCFKLNIHIFVSNITHEA